MNIDPNGHFKINWDSFKEAFRQGIKNIFSNIRTKVEKVQFGLDFFKINEEKIVLADINGNLYKGSVYNIAKRIFK